MRTRISAKSAAVGVMLAVGAGAQESSARASTLDAVALLDDTARQMAMGPRLAGLVELVITLESNVRAGQRGMGDTPPRREVTGFRRALWGNVLDLLAAEYRSIRNEGAEVPVGMMRLLLLTHEKLADEILVDALTSSTTHPGTPRHRALLDRQQYDHLADSLLLAAGAPEEGILGHLYKLHEGETDDRVRHALVIGKMKDVASDVTAHLVRALADEDNRVVQEVITALGMIGPAAEDAVPALERLAEHADRQIATRARAALRQIPVSRVSAAATITPTGGAVVPSRVDERRIGELVDQLRGEVAGDWSGQLSEVCRFSRPNSRLAIDRLVEVVPETPTANLAILVRTAVDLSVFYGEGIRERIEKDIIKQIGFGLHLREVHGQFGAELSRLIALSGSGFDGFGSVDYLIERLQHNNSYVRGEAARLLGLRGVEAASALPSLRHALASEHPRVAQVTGYSVSGDRVSFIGMRPRSHDPVVHMNVARAMIRIASDDPSTTGAHVFLLQHGGEDEQRAAASALAHLGPDATAVAALLSALKSEDLILLREATTALGMIGPAARDAIPSLEKLTGHADPQIVERAKAALRQVRGG